jgi:hypothetical protein
VIACERRRYGESGNPKANFNTLSLRISGKNGLHLNALQRHLHGSFVMIADNVFGFGAIARFDGLEQEFMIFRKPVDSP